MPSRPMKLASAILLLVAVPGCTDGGLIDPDGIWFRGDTDRRSKVDARSHR